MSIDEIKEKVKTVKNKMNVNSITVSRVVKNKHGGDVFLSMTSSLDDGVSLKDARIASHILALECNLLAHEQACAVGIINEDVLDNIKRHLKNNMSDLIIEKGNK